jgi:cytochrome c-type biogenesis protein CcmH/NrfG
MGDAPMITWSYLEGFLILGAIAAATALLLAMRSDGSRPEQLDLKSFKGGLDDIGASLKLGTLTEAEADAARLDLLTRMQASQPGLRSLPAMPQALPMVGAVFLLVSAIGAAATPYLRPASSTTTTAESAIDDAAGDKTLADLKAYATSIPSDGAASKPVGQSHLADVNTMIERLAARLQQSPDDVQGWRMLGFSYFHTERFAEAADAFEKAVELDPASDDLKRARDDAKAKASGTAPVATSNAAAAAPVQTGSIASSSSSAAPSADPHAAMMQQSASPAADPTIRAMVDRLAKRLESSPHDLAGWANLMRSRVVLGDRPAAVAALRKALDVFKDDPASTRAITMAAAELDVKTD